MSLPTLRSSPRQDCLTSEFQPLSQYHVGDKFISVIFGELVISAAKIEKRKEKKKHEKKQMWLLRGGRLQQCTGTF